MDPQNNTPSGNGTPMAADNNRTLMGILAYVGILVIIPYLMARHDPFVKFHVRQGLVLLCIEIAVWILGSIFWPLWMILWLVNLATLVLVIIGIVNVVQKQEKPLPVVGHLAGHFKI